MQDSDDGLLTFLNTLRTAEKNKSSCFWGRPILKMFSGFMQALPPNVPEFEMQRYERRVKNTEKWLSVLFPEYQFRFKRITSDRALCFVQIDDESVKFVLPIALTDRTPN